MLRISCDNPTRDYAEAARHIALLGLTKDPKSGSTTVVNLHILHGNAQTLTKLIEVLYCVFVVLVSFYEVSPGRNR